jgi:queuine/archaeosine tRNA-ribosyltransferase
LGHNTKSDAILTRLIQEYGFGRGHAKAFLHVVENGVDISDSTWGSAGAGSNSDRRRL